jgi:hypothetical protein
MSVRPAKQFGDIQTGDLPTRNTDPIRIQRSVGVRRHVQRQRTYSVIRQTLGSLRMETNVVAHLEPLTNPLKHEMNINNIKKFASYLTKTYDVSFTKKNQLTQFREIIAIYCENHILQTNIALKIAVWNVTS